MSRYWAGGNFGEHSRVRWPISANTTNSSWNTTRYSWNTTNTFPNTTRYYLNTTKVYRNATQFYWNTTQFSQNTTQYLRSTKKDLILLLRSAEFVTIQSMNLTFIHRYWKLPHFFVIRVTICRVRMSRYWALSGTVAHICKHNKQFLKHNMIFLEHNKHFSKHNMVLSKHNKRLSKHDTVLLKDNTIIPWLWLAMIRSLCGRLKSLLLYFGDFDIRF